MPETRVLGGRYQLGESIGIGGMAEVHVASDVRLGRSVAVKVLRADLARDPAFHSRFRREAQAAASLSAPTIVSVYDTGQDEDASGTQVPWIVMELVDGRTLREVLTDEGRLLPTRALEVVAEVCQALQVAHDAGIVHRDVKPGNVMLSRTGEVKVMDFGIARAVSSHTLTETASIMGTAAYLSPEQARGEHVDARSDIYSTGCLLYELLTGSPPFTGDSAVAVAYQHVREDPTPPSDWDRSLPRGVDAVVLKAMAKNPANRYQSAVEMAEDLLRAARGRPVLATPVLVQQEVIEEEPSETGRPGEVSQRTRTVVYAAGAVALLLYVVVLAAGLSSLLSSGSGSIITAPNLTDPRAPVSQQAALSELAANGLSVGQVRAVYSTAPVGRVLAQEPKAGVVVDDDRVVDLVVSHGPERSRVPAVKGLQRDEAEALLREVKLRLGDTIFRDGNISQGTVLEVIPPAGTIRTANTAVQLVVATGNVQVPGVVGLTVQEAANALQRAGLNVGLRYVDDPGAPGIVLWQSERGRSVIDRQSDVILNVSQVPPPVTPVLPEAPVAPGVPVQPEPSAPVVPTMPP